MKHYIHTSALMGLMILMAGAVVVACQKDSNAEFNPPTDDSLVAAPFTLTAEEHRGTTGATFDWVITNGSTDSVTEELDEMTVTAYNSFTITVEPKGNPGAFPGVNLRSSNVNAVQVEKKDKTHFTLKYIGDGEARIRVWNGNESANTTVEFPVKSVNAVEVTGLRYMWYECDKSVLSEVKYFVTWTGPDTYETRTVKERRYLTYIDKECVASHELSFAPKMRDLSNGADVVSFEDIPFGYDAVFYGDYHEIDENLNDLAVKGNYYHGHELTFLGLEPENASFRTILSFESEYDMHNMHTIWKDGGYCNGHEAIELAEAKMPGYPKRDPADYAWLNSKTVNKDVSELEGMKAFLTNNSYAGENFYLAVVGVKSKDNSTKYFAIGHNRTYDKNPE